MAVTRGLWAARSGRGRAARRGRRLSLLVGLLLGLLVACSPWPTRVARPAAWPCLPRGFATPAPDTWNRIMPQVRAYFYYRKQAVLRGDIRVLWEQYPALAQGQDPTRGINAEADEVAAYIRDGRPPVDGQIALTAYEPLRVRRQGDRWQVFVHGWEEYWYPRPQGGLDISGQEFLLLLTFQEHEEGLWRLQRTDAVTLQEYHQCRP